MKRILLILGISHTLLYAQSLEPRLYSNAPVGLNFLIAGYAFSQGALADNPTLDINDPRLDVHATVLALAHVYGFLGQSGKINIALPAMCIDGEAQQYGQNVSRNVCGLGDVKLGISYNLLGAPALSLKEFGGYQQEWIVGIRLQTTMPTGQYDENRLVNISTHRWALKSGVGISKAFGDVVIELAADAEFYSKNSEFYGGVSRKQDNVYSIQSHLIYNFSKGAWVGMDANYFWGGDYVTNNIRADKPLENSRIGATLAMPISRYQSLKFYGHSGIVARTGTNFDVLGVAWQYRF